MSEVVVRRFEDGEWADESRVGESSQEMLERARASGYRRKRLLAGEGNVFLTYVEMGPRFTVEPHSHDVQEIIHIVAGGLTPAGGRSELGTGDSLIVPAGEVYGFTTGSEGVTFLIFRPADASITHAR